MAGTRYWLRMGQAWRGIPVAAYGDLRVASLYIGSQMPLTVMFRPPRVAWAEPMMRAGRDRMQIKSEPPR